MEPQNKTISRAAPINIVLVSITIALMGGSLFFTGCGITPTPTPTPTPVPPVTAPEISDQGTVVSQINQAAKQNGQVAEVANPNLTLPAGIDSAQIQKYFKVDGVYLALVQRSSQNVVLFLPSGFAPTFTGVLAARAGDKEWTKLGEIQDSVATDKNNPYYLTVENQKLLLTVVDQNGAGSGEGNMGVFALSDSGSWDLQKCYYFGAHYSDPSVNGDYFAYSIKFSEQQSQANDACGKVTIK